MARDMYNPPETVAVSLDAELKAKIKAAAKREARSASSWIRLAVLNEFERRENSL